MNLEELVQSFWYHINENQYELANAVLQLVKNVSEESYNVLLISLITDTCTKYEKSSDSLEHYLHSWLALTEYVKNDLTNCKYSKNISSPDQVKIKLEFIMILKSLGTDVSPKVFKELLYLFDQDTAIKNKEVLSEEITYFIRKLAPQDAQLCFRIIDLLSHHANIKTLRRVLLKDEIECLLQNSHRLTKSFLLLSIGTWYLDHTDKQQVDVLNNAISVLLEQKKHIDICNLSVSLVKKFKLIQLIDTQVKDFILASFKSTSTSCVNLELAEIIVRAIDSPNEQDWFLLVLMCFNNKVYILQCILDACFYLISMKEHKRAASLISSPLLSPLKPLVLLVSWAQCATFEDAIVLLDHFHNSAEKGNFLTCGVEKLAYQAKLMQWCLEKMSKILGHELNNSSIFKLAFRHLESSCALFILKETELLKELKHEVIIDILEKQPVMNEGSIRSEEINIYLSFTVIKHLLSIIIASLNGIFKDKNGVLVPYSTELMRGCVHELKTDIEKIEPLELRIELLENIFSLLFLKTADLKDQEKDDIDCENPEELTLNNSISFSLDSLSTFGDNSPRTFGEYSPNTVRVSSPCNTDQQKINHSPNEFQDLSEIIQGNSSGIITNNGVELVSLPQTFLCEQYFVEECLKLLSDCLLSEKSKTMKKTADFPVSDKEIKVSLRLSQLLQYTREAEWRLQIASGFKKSFNSSFRRVLSNPYKEHIIGRMLAPPATLVYLTLQKGDIFQAKHVIKMFDLKDDGCVSEVDFIEEFSSTSKKLLQISQLDKNKRLGSNLDNVRFAASTGKMSSDIYQMVEDLLHHSFIKNSSSSLLTCLAACVDLMFQSPLVFNVCNSIFEKIIGLKNDITGICSSDQQIYHRMMDKIKVLKFLAASSNQIEFFEYLGQKKPSGISAFVIYLPLYLDVEKISSFNKTLTQGKTLFLNLYEHLLYLQKTYQNLEQVQDGISLTSRFKEFLSLFDSEVMAQLGNVSFASDYFRSLFKYVEKLAALQLIHKNRSKTGNDIIKAANPFLVLDNDIMKIFGVLLFKWEVLPKKLEMFAKKFHVNLVKVIATSCDFSVSLLSKGFICNESMLFKEKMVLNSLENHQLIQKTGNPFCIIEKLLQDLLEKLSGMNEYSPELTVSEICQVMHVSSQDLIKVDARMLDTLVKIKSFFINLYNLLLLHGILLIIAGKFTTPHKISPYDIPLLLCQSVSQLAMLNSLAYQVGDHVYSAFDILKKIFSAKDDLPYLSLLSNGSIYSSNVQVVKPSDLSSLLQSSGIEFLNKSITVDTELKKVSIQKMLVANLLFMDQHVLLSHDKQSLLKMLQDIVVNFLPTLATLSTALHENYAIVIAKPKITQNAVESLFSPMPLDELDILKGSNFKLSDPVTDYLDNTCPLAGILIQLHLEWSAILRQYTDEHSGNLDFFKTRILSLENKLSAFCAFSSKYIKINSFISEMSLRHVKLLKTLSTTYSTDIIQEEILYNSLKTNLSKDLIWTMKPSLWSVFLNFLIEYCSYTKKIHILFYSHLDLLNSLSVEVFDMLVCCGVHEIKVLLRELFKNGFENNISKINELRFSLKRLLLLIKKSEKQMERVLSCVALLSASDATDLLRICLQSESLSEQNLADLRSKCKEVVWLEKINVVSKTGPFESWYDIKQLVKKNPEKLISLLISVKRFDLLDEWELLFNMTSDHLQQSIEGKLIHLIEKDHSDHLTILNVLMSVKNSKMCLSICESVLQKQTCYSKSLLYVIEYMLKHNLLSPGLKKVCLENKIGILCIELISAEYQKLYKDLQSYPLLLLEQLLMNAKVSTAGQVVNCIRRLASTEVMLRHLIKECDDLIEKYASFSLDIKEAQAYKNFTPAQSPSLRKRTIKLPPLSPLNAQLSPSDQSESLRDRGLSVSYFKEKREFVPPTESVDRNNWVKDSQVTTCMQCNDLFNMFNRRHHCRHCGRVVCAPCSDFNCYVQQYKKNERICLVCYHSQYVYTSSIENINNIATTPRSLPKSTKTPSENTNSEAGVNEPEWKLSVDSNQNKVVYDDFYYEQAPSAPLCLSIIDMHSNETAASGLLVKFCSKLSQYIQSKTDFDSNMVVGIIEFILNHAKLKFTKAGDDGGVSLCDFQLSYVELLKTLLTANWREVPTIQDFTNPECLRMLREKLMEQERFSLALEITNKAGLDLVPVFFLMGMAKLKSGHLEKARDHFSHCLTATRGISGNSFSPNTYYLEKIVHIIESSPLLLLPFHVSRDTVASPVPSFQERSKSFIGDLGLDKSRYDEIIFYLSTYGSHAQTINFFLRHHLLKNAVIYVKENKCSHETFTKHLLTPCFKEGCFDQLFEELRLSDSSLRFWEVYFTNACKELSKQGYYNCLFQLQLAIKDYFRAALTCVRFYLGTNGQPPSSFGDLVSRKKHLQDASKYLEIVLKDRSSGFVSHIPSFLADEKLLTNREISISEMKRYLTTVNLQMEVTEFMYNLEEKEGKIAEKPISTLFGNGKERAELAVKILESSSGNGLSLVSRIIQEFKLPAAAIFRRSISRLAQKMQFDQANYILQNIEQNGMIRQEEKDEILIQVVKVISLSDQLKNVNIFLKQIKDDILKIRALISCGRLKDAYLEAVKKEFVSEIQDILESAKKFPNQRTLVDICEKWLKTYREKKLKEDEQRLNEAAARLKKK